MDGIHDLGGKQGYGPIELPADSGRNEPVFHADWEAKVFSFLAAARRSGAMKNTDQFRHAIERIDPRAYLTHGYYGRWLGGLESLLVEAGVLTSAEIESRVAGVSNQRTVLVAARPSANPDTFDYEPEARHARRPLSTAAKFRLGDRVRAVRFGVPGHTRLPQYVRGAQGTVTVCHDGWVYPDTNAHGRGESPQPLYTVEFTGRELWGSDGEADLAVCIDLFEPYLERAE